ncbi:MAG TPA: hypothetical protein VGR37_14890 [Longimicrobiaceae bacterium]|nr:hypothetical protein [Longimicrobiaceae bacterium]
MDAQILQTLVVAGSLAGAALYLGRRALAAVGVGKKEKKGGCGGGCGCSHG